MGSFGLPEEQAKKKKGFSLEINSVIHGRMFQKKAYHHSLSYG
jgi:hypothetical protein